MAFPLFLDKADPGLSVPKFYWKLVVEAVDNLGVVLIGVNSPHVTEDEVDADYR